MINYEQYIIKQGDNELGLLWSDIEEHLLTPALYKEFVEFMGGQTVGVLGKLGEKHEYLSYVYRCDFTKFLRIKKLN